MTAVLQKFEHLIIDCSSWVLRYRTSCGMVEPYLIDINKQGNIGGDGSDNNKAMMMCAKKSKSINLVKFCFMVAVFLDMQWLH